MHPLPEGIVTFLFTDVEGSTRLATELGDAAWRELLEAHRHILRQAFSAHAGREVGTQGDAFFVVFARATDAVTAAISAQHALEGHPWPANRRLRVRIGLHTGEALTDGDNYVGQEVHRGSRICDAAHGGQIVLSQTTADLVRDGLSDRAILTDLGEHRLKDLGDAQRLFQLVGMGLQAEFPRLRSLDAVRHNLPAERSSFVGREKEIEAVRLLLSEHRLVTLTGVGGSGKTRLALQVGAHELACFPDGVFFVDLTPVTDPDLVAPAVATAAGFAFGDSLAGSVDDWLVATLARRRCLLLVDNCEHLLDVVAALVDRILAGCPGVFLVATSREALAIEGEQIVQVPSLTVPDDASQAGEAEAVRLFVERAKSVKPAFALGPDNRAPVAEICRRLDGIPLAIEFAAARIAHLSARQIADRLADRFHLLTGGRRRIPRQQTLEAALDWSYDLLTDGERIVFRRLAVFAGSFSLDAAEAVCINEDSPVGSALDALGSLVAKSLVTAAEDEWGQTRYRLLETVRMYAAGKLAAAEEADVVRVRHCDWYLAWIGSVPLEELTFSPPALRAALADLENIRAAADWCVGDDRPDLLARLVTPLLYFWAFGGAHLEAARRVQDALRDEARLTSDERVACHTLLAITMNTALQGEISFEHASRAIDLAGEQPSPFLVIALGLRAFGNSVRAVFPGAEPHFVLDARRDLEAARAAAGAGLPVEWRAWAEFWSGMVETNLGELRAASTWWTALIETCGVIKQREWLLPQALAGLAVSLHMLGETDEALHAALRFHALPLLPTHPFSTVRLSISEIAPALAAGGRDDVARDVLRGAAREVHLLGFPLAENHLLSMIAVVEHLRGRPERAGRLLGAARHVNGAADLPIPFRTPASYALYRHYLPIVRETLGPEEARRARDEGSAMPLEVALAYGLGGLD